MLILLRLFIINTFLTIKYTDANVKADHTLDVIFHENSRDLMSTISYYCKVVFYSGLNKYTLTVLHTHTHILFNCFKQISIAKTGNYIKPSCHSVV